MKLKSQSSPPPPKKKRGKEGDLGWLMPSLAQSNIDCPSHEYHPSPASEVNSICAYLPGRVYETVLKGSLSRRETQRLLKYRPNMFSPLVI